MLPSINEYSFIIVFERIVESFILTPALIITLGPITTLGPIIADSSIIAVESYLFYNNKIITIKQFPIILFPIDNCLPK